MTDDRGGESAEGLGNQDQVLAIPRGLNHGLRVRREAGVVVVTRQIHRHDSVTTLLELGHDQVPQPGF